MSNLKNCFMSLIHFFQITNAGKALSQETQLLLYALEQQATKGPCKSPKPGGWGGGSAEDIAKWQSWSHLKDMNKMEAMRLYVRTVEEEQASVYSMLILRSLFPLKWLRGSSLSSWISPNVVISFMRQS
jgi:acyl-CoA-binding protein